MAKSLYKKYYFYNRTQAFERRYKKIDQNLFQKSLGKEILEKYKNKWEVYGKKVEVKTFLLCYNISGKIDYNIVPENLFAAIIEPSLNPHKELSIFAVKNIYERWFNYNGIFPETYLHKINNVYYDSRFQIVTDIGRYLNEAIFEFPLILKPSRDTFGGAGVVSIENMEELRENLDNYNDLICQERISQHKGLNIINPGINSIRTCLYRTENGKFEVISNSIRFGVKGGLDNLKAGGIVCNINNDGDLNAYALDIYGVKHVVHPDSGIPFSSISILHYNELNKVAREIADAIPLCNLLSLDMCLDSNDQWRCLEVNVIGQTIRFAQYAGKGFFDKYTDEVIEKTSLK